MPGYARPTNVVPSLYVTNTPSGNISATTVAGALTELDSEKAKLVPAQSSAPSGPQTSDLWIDNSSSTTPQLKIYDGSSWQVVGPPSDSDQNIIANQVFR